ncbi:MAG TPA: ATP-binding protein [Candidatus Binatia bacterium]|nr:ATP-binding protein [Candidatus Binatia bacterium]
MRPDPVTEAYREKSWQVAARQLPLAFAIFLFLVLAANVLEYVKHSSRLPHLLAFDAICLATVAVIAVAARRGPAAGRTAAIAGTVVLGLLLNAYGAAVRGSAEMLVVNLGILLAGVALLCPWGARGQAVASTGAVLGYPLALVAGIVPAIDPLYGLGGLAAIAGLTIRGAGLIDHHRRSDFRAMAELRGREARLQGYFDLALVGMAGLSPWRAWLEANDEVSRMLGYGRSELLRLRWDDVVHPDERARHESWFDRAQSGAREDFKAETRLVRKDGDPFHAMVALRALRRPHGGIDSFVALIEDLTEHRLVEEELRAAKEQAEAANRSKSDFLATMSHEIRTPMNLIFGMTEMALDSDPTPQQREYLRKTRAAAGTLQVLLNDVLDFSKIEAGKLEVRPRAFPLREWLDESLGPLSWLAREKGLDVACEVDPAVPQTVLLDPDRLGQVIVNLVTNAIKFTDRGGVRISVAASSEDGAASSLHFVVADSGIGIPAPEQARIFDAFAQATPAQPRARGGAGLGLAICARLVGLMGGRIWVESAVGSGSRFHFTARYGASSVGEAGSSDAPEQTPDPLSTAPVSAA